jgi:hypothetical protein
MKRVIQVLWGTAVIALGVFFVSSKSPAQALNVVYGPNGLQQLTYNGVILEDTSQWPEDGFHIWHMKMTDLSGNVLTAGQYGWGETNSGRVWNSSSHTWTYTFSWGSIQVQYVVQGNNLNIAVTETNLAGSGVILDGAVVYPIAVHFPQLPLNFVDPTYPQLAFTTEGPSVVNANYGSGDALSVLVDASRPLYSGFQPSGDPLAYTALISGTAPDGLATFNPHFDRPVLPGQSDTFTVSLRFAAAGTPATTVAADAYASWAKTWPAQLSWPDRRAIGTVYLASSPTGPANLPGGYPNNPRRYFNDSNAYDFDVTTAAGLIAFQHRMLQQAQQNVINMRALGAQGSITWDIEGEQYPQATSYVCSPDEIAQAAPEMESVVADPQSSYVGMKLDDAYFKTMTDAGFKIGVCIRPQQFTINPDGSATQVTLPAAAVAAQLQRKIAYAHDRWGARLFYIDSSVDQYGGAFDPSILQQVAAAFPDSLLIPEETYPKDYAYVAAFQSFLFHGSTGTNSTVYTYYPNAFSAILINDVDPAVLAAAVPKLTQSVRSGDILMGHVDYAQANNATIVAIYQGASTSAPTTPPATSPPATAPASTLPPTTASTANVSIGSPLAGATLSGVTTVTAAMAAQLDAAGSYLMVDGQEYGTQRVFSPPFLYALDTSGLAAGQHTLQIWAHTISNMTLISAPILVTVVH